jgi:glycine betaine/proline transport system substrate-binding protein
MGILTKTLTASLALSLLSGVAFAAECSTVKFSDVGWTDITTTTFTTKHVLEALGYKVDIKVLSLPVTFASLENKDIDVFLGAWMPSMEATLNPYLDSGSIEKVTTNLTGTIYTLAVPAYTYDAGLHDYSNIVDFADSLGSRIYGIEAGNEGNAYLISLTEEDKFGLGKFRIVESSEQGMLAEVARAVADSKDIVFLGWQPHPMNSKFSIKYLTGGEDFFGGEGVVDTVVRKGYVAECPNVGKLLTNLKFSLPMENDIMDKILNDAVEPDEATLEWIKTNGDTVLSWVDGVTTLDGGDGAAAIKTAFGY